MATEVEVWAVPADAPVPGALPGEEQARVDRLRRPEDRALAATACRVARAVLGERLSAETPEVTRTCTVCGHPDHGKPTLAGGGPSSNLSHAPRTVLLAVCEGAEVGVDLEPRSADLREVAADVLTSAEVAARLDPLTAWVRTEAVLRPTAVGSRCR